MRFKATRLSLAALLLVNLALYAQVNTIPNGSFENAEMPAHWTKMDPFDADVSWATDQFRSAQRSLKISEAAGADAPAWVSKNLAKLYWNPTTGINPSVEMKIGGWVKTENVNTNPATDADKIQLIYQFFDASGAQIFGQDVVLDVPQSQSSTDWTQIQNDTPVVLPVSADSMVVIFKFGANATGTAWLDDIFMRNAEGASGWLGSLFNGNFGVPEGWFFWKGGMDEGLLGKGDISISSDFAHSGNFSLLISDDPANGDEVVAMSNRNPIEPGRSYGISAWVKMVGANPNPTKDVEKAIFFTLTYHSGDAGWAEVAGEDFFVINQSASDRDWTLYNFTFTPPANANRVSVRARFQHQATGKVYWDDFRIYPVEMAKTNLTFDEIDLPAYWNSYNSAEATVAWTSDVYRSPEKSLQISDAGGADEPMWMSTNMAQLNWNPTTGLNPNIEFEVGGWVKTENVNTNPASDAEKIQLIYQFFDAAKNQIFGQDVVVDLPQAQPSTDWTPIKSDVTIVLPVAADSVVIKFKFGANATGTAWLDDIFMTTVPGASGWLGGPFNENFGTPAGWFYWKGGASDALDKGIVTVTERHSHSGKYSLLVADAAGNADEVVAISDRNTIKPATEYLVSAWVKLENATLNPERDVEKSVFFTVTYHTSDAGWAEVSGQDFFVIPQTETDRGWGLYSFRLTTPENATRMSLRARLQHQATGNIYWDDFQVVEMATPKANLGFENTAMPACWKKVNEADAILEWTSEQYRSEFMSLKISESGGNDSPAWVSGNFAKMQWNPTTGLNPNIEFYVGGWVKTENVNTNPATAADEIHLVYSFWDAAGAMIFGEPVVVKIPQTNPTVDWTQIKSEMSVVLPVSADSMTVALQFGANATGTVWLDDIFTQTAEGATGWLGGMFNTNFGTPPGWFYWKGGADDAVDKGIVSVTRKFAHTGDYSLLVADVAGNGDEVVAISDRLQVESNKVYMIEAYVKTEGVILNPEKDVEKSVFFTVTYHTGEAGWAEVSGQDFFVVDQTVADKDWSRYSFVLTTPANATRLSVRARLQHQATGNVYWDDFAIVEGDVSKLNKDANGLPLVYRLDQNYPNPFNPETTIQYTIPQDSKVTINIYNMLGQQIRNLVETHQRAGNFQITWDGRNDAGIAVSSGIYFYVLQTDDARMLRKMTLLK